MSYVTTAPEALSATAADQLSTLAAAQFSVHAQMYQAVSTQAEAIRQQLVSTLETNATS